jgi:PleD family two-component response regulator
MNETTYDRGLLLPTIGNDRKGGMLPSRAEHEPPKALRSLRILIVDDDVDAALMLMMILGDEGHDVRALYSGRNIAGAMIDFGPDAVLLDIEMPEKPCRELGLPLVVRLKIHFRSL